MDALTEKQSKKSKRKKAPTRGGARANSGRPKGVTNKISPAQLLTDFKKQSGMSFEQFVNSKIIEASDAKNHDLVAKYLLGLSKYFIQDVQEVDITSNGQSVGVGFSFPTIELEDWNSDTSKKTN